ncbi:MAG: phytoene desaturase family protein [Candidatus Hodarchaeales archaeon]|jgi:phytoene desaturase
MKEANQKNTNLIIIGAGLGGIAAAIRMQAAGYTVYLLEKTNQIGGKASVFKINDYIFDAGPTAITVPHLIQELFELNNENMNDYLELIPIIPYFRIYFHDGSHFNYSTPEENMNQIKEISPEDLQGYQKMMKSIEPIFKKGFLELSDKPFNSFLSMVKIGPPLIRLGAYRSVYSYVSKYIKNKKLRMVFSYHPLLIGGNPFKITAIYMLIQAVEKKWGVWFARGGTHSLIQELGNLFTRLGGKIILNSEVERIDISDKSAVKAVTTRDGQTYEASIVISNAPVASTYMKMIEEKFRKKNSNKRYRKATYSMSVFMIYFGTNRKYSDLHAHNILLGPRYKKLIKDIFTRKQLSEEGDFSAYLYIPTRIDPTLAPEGGESCYILVPVPNQDSGIIWEETKQLFRDNIIKFLEMNFMPDLRRHIEVEKILTPADFKNLHSDYKGAVFSLAPTFTQSAYFRPHNKSEDIKGLYIVGAGTHPGGGIPGVITSAKITSNLILNNVKDQ